MRKIIISNITSQMIFGFAAFIAFMPFNALAQIQFFEDTQNSGISHNGESWGASWGELNGDAFPDLFVNNHRSQPGLYINSGNGTFTDKHTDIPEWNKVNTGDQHGSTWADFDNDGDNDLFVSTGARSNNQFFVNQNGLLVYKSADYNVDDLGWGGMFPVWIDFNNDSLLDVIYMQRGQGKPKVLKQTATGFEDILGSGINCTNSYYGQLSDLNNDGTMEFICATFNTPGRIIYDMTTTPYSDISAILPSTDPVGDSAIADFDGDLRTDVFHVRGAERFSSAAKTGNKTLEAQFLLGGESEKSFTFSTNGVITFIIHWIQRNRNDIYIGSTGWQPSGFSGEEPINFSLDPSDQTTWGIMDHEPGVDKGMYIGYDDSTGYWNVVFSAGSTQNNVYYEISSTTPVSDVRMTKLWNSELPMLPALFMNEPGGFQDRTLSNGFDTPIECTSVTSGDFDNDMDLDLYLVCRRGVENLPNRLYENQGNGTFLPVTDAGGAMGVVGTGVNSGETAVVADYNLDGFLDLFVTNGQNYMPEPPYTLGGPDQLFQNQGNQNNWIEIDLAGTLSNGSGIGAKVFVTTGGVTQLREQNGGYHRYSQDHQRLHFGLADNTQVDIKIEWPSGVIDTYSAIQSNQLYKATEDTDISVVNLNPAPPSPCNAPTYDGAVDGAVFLWQDCTTGQWSLRATAGSLGFAQYSGNLDSNLGFSSITPVSLEAGDTFDTTSPTQIVFDLSMASPWSDGFDFTLPVGTSACMTIDSVVQLGATRTPVSAPFNLQDFGPCSPGTPSLTINDLSIGEADGMANFTVTLSPVSTGIVTVDVSTADGTATAANDYTAITTTTLTYNPGDTSKIVSVPIVDDANPEGKETFTVNLGNATNAQISKASGIGTIIDNDTSVCDAPSYDAAIDGAMFLWKDCATGQWSIRATAGNQGFSRYIGDLSSTLGFTSTTPFSLEASDTFDTTNPNLTVFSLQMSSPWSDGFDFILPAGTNTCLTVDSIVQVGVNRTPVNSPFNLETLGPCI